jgi:glycosyltransferase involved in cell wall biosynthesis
MPLDVSVILATRNRADLLEADLRAMAAQAPSDVSWEVMVVDNGSTDRTEAVLRAAQGFLPLVALSEPVPGKNRALNRALPLARGELLVFTDDDVLPQPGWISELASASRRWPAATIFAGQILHSWPDGTPDWLRMMCREGALNFGLYSLAQPEGPTERLPSGPNFAVRAAVVREMRFHEGIGPRAGTQYAMGSETELLQRMADNGERVIYVPSAAVLHVIQPWQLEPANLYRRSFRYGRGQVRRLRKSSASVVYWLGAPRYLWRMAAEAGLRYGLSLLGTRRGRLAAGLNFHYLRGVIYQFLQDSGVAPLAVADP